MLIDTHAHLNFNAYKADFDEVIKRSLGNNACPVRNRISNGVWMINVGSQYTTSKRAVEIAQKYPEGVYAAVGLHPIHLAEGIFKVKMDPAELSSTTHGASEEESKFTTKAEEFSYQKYKELAESKKVVAIGEIGLDYYYRPKTQKKLGEFKNKQKEVFLKQLSLAKELNLPVIFHCRMAHQDLIEILKSKFQNPNDKIKGVIHCFTGTLEQAKEYLETGFYLGFNGIIFKLNLDEIIKKTPLERILIETDCPYLTPPKESGRNEPVYVKYVAQKIAELKNLSFEKVAEITTQNAKALFKI